MSPNNSRRFSGGGRPDWPKFLVRNINPELWEQVKARAVRESTDGSPRLNGVLLHLLEAYAQRGLPALAGFPKAGASVSPTPHPTPDPTVSPTPDPD